MILASHASSARTVTGDVLLAEALSVQASLRMEGSKLEPAFLPIEILSFGLPSVFTPYIPLPMSSALLSVAHVQAFQLSCHCKAR